MLNEIYNGGEMEEERMKRVIGLFRIDFPDRSALRAAAAGAPVFLDWRRRPMHAAHETAESAHEPAACEARMTAANAFK